jgi:hypothetical protein
MGPILIVRRAMKKNIRRIPDDIVAKLKTIKGDDIVVGCAVIFKAADLAGGKLKHLKVKLTNNGLEIPPSIMPVPSQGKFSAKNVDGEVIVRKDLPKEMHSRTIDSPNWGDSSKGTHPVDLPYEKYPREFKPPRELTISISAQNGNPGLSAYVLAFKVNEVLNKKSKHFKTRLFENLNLLQENVGTCGVEAADVALDEYAKS